MLDRVFGESALHLNTKLARVAARGGSVNIEASFSQLTLDVIGKAVFNYDFGSLDKDSTLIQAVYTALKETESRATDLLPFWKFPLLNFVIPRQRKAMAAVAEIRATTEMLIKRCKEMVDEEEKTVATGADEYVNAEDPSILRFLIASRDEVSAVQLRDDLLGMLVAGHETTASVLTWTIYLLAQCPDQMQKLQVCSLYCTCWHVLAPRAHVDCSWSRFLLSSVYECFRRRGPSWRLPDASRPLIWTAMPKPQLHCRPDCLKMA
jgi:carotenoid epsilon hydroxylase